MSGHHHSHHPVSVGGSSFSMSTIFTYTVELTPHAYERGCGVTNVLPLHTQRGAEVELRTGTYPFCHAKLSVKKKRLMQDSDSSAEGRDLLKGVRRSWAQSKQRLTAVNRAAVLIRAALLCRFHAIKRHLTHLKWV